MKIGILGGGQLAQMLAQAGAPLGMEFMFLCPNPDACAAGLGTHICAPFDDPQALKQLGEWSDVVTFEFENVPAGVVDALEGLTRIHPPGSALSVAQDRLREKLTFLELGIPTAAFAAVDSLEGLHQAVEKIGLPAVLKTRTQGYDGKGQAILRETSDLQTAWETIGGVPLILEAFVPFTRELSIIAARSTHGETRCYPLSENHHREGILRLSLSTRGEALQTQAEKHVELLLDHLDYVGVLALELFQTPTGLVANEFAPRVHNSGHWSIEGARASQFENHLRAVSGMPLGEPETPRPVAMINLVGELPDAASWQPMPGATPHIYGKAGRPGRKIGHVTLVAAGNEPDPVFYRNVSDLLLATGETQLAADMRDAGKALAQPAAGKPG